MAFEDSPTSGEYYGLRWRHDMPCIEIHANDEGQILGVVFGGEPLPFRYIRHEDNGMWLAEMGQMYAQNHDRKLIGVVVTDDRD